MIELEDGINGYVDLVNYVLNNGKPVSPRGQNTLEIEDAVIRIKNVHDTLPIGTGRGVVPGIGAVEACQLLSGLSVPELVIGIGPQFANYTEDNGIFHGAYGPRTVNQYSHIVERLRKDPSTRQAVVTIWNPEFDLQESKRDYPCTILHQFRIRDNKLNMSVYMRSNDVWLGAAYDFFQFTRVQIAIASILGVEPGVYTHHVGSLHIYEQHYELSKSLHYADNSVYGTVPAFTIPEEEEEEEGIYVDWDYIKLIAGIAIAAVTSEQDMLFLNRTDSAAHWYAAAMKTAYTKNSTAKKESETKSK